MAEKKTTTKTESKKEVKEVTVYSTPTCPWCHVAKDYLKQNKVTFTDKNVAVDYKAREEMVEKTGQLGVPVLDIGGRMIIGFDKQQIDRLLGL